MAQTGGLVQKLWISEDSSSVGGANQPFACAWIGSTPTNAELLLVRRFEDDPAHIGSFKNNIVGALVVAEINRREVMCVHGDSDSRITDIWFVQD